MSGLILPDSVKIESEDYLLLGGPAHGEIRELSKGQNEATVMASSRPNSVPEPVVYVRRNIQAQTPRGIFQRTIFVERSMPVTVATQALQALLLQQFAAELLGQWMEGGELVASDTE